MKIKKRLKIIGLLLVVLIACLVGVFTINAPTTAEAATTKNFTVQFDYVNNKIVSTLGNHLLSYRYGKSYFCLDGSKPMRLLRYCPNDI